MTRQARRPMACVIALFAVQLAFANIINETEKLLPDDGLEGDSFGEAIAIDNGVVIIGAPFRDGAEVNSGAAYLFDLATGLQIGTLLADDGDVSDLFGLSVDIHDGLAIVGAPLDDDEVFGVDAGAAYLFDVDTGQQLHKLLPDDGDSFDFFGRAVAIHDGVAIVGSYWDDPNGAQSGSAYLFDVSPGDSFGEQIAKLEPEDGAANDLFGLAVDIHDGVVVVGAPFDDVDDEADVGSAYLFDASTGDEINQLLASDGGTGDLFGRAVAIHNGVVIVGAYRNFGNGSESGAAYLFNATTGQELAKLVPDDGELDDEFGRAVGIHDGVAVVAADRNDDNGDDSGSAYLFDASTGLQIAKVLPSDGAEEDEFGAGVAIRNGVAVIGAVGDDDNGEDAGAAYIVDPCPADLSADGVVEAADLFALLGAWGPCDGCPADLNNSGAVDVDDLFILLGQWGPC